MKNTIKLGLCSAVALALASSAYATSNQLRYSVDGANWTVISDGGAGDLDATANNNITVLVLGGGFNLTITTHGFNAGTAASPDIDLDIAGSALGAGTLIVEYSDTGFTPVPTGSYLLHAGGSLGSGVTDISYALVGDNTLYAGTTPTAPGSPFPPASIPGGGVIGPINGFGDAIHGAFASQANPYSLTLVQVITTTGTGIHSISDDLHLTVPDGGNTLMMLGSALSVLGLGVFRRKAKKA
jgi:hypothetical protein